MNELLNWTQLARLQSKLGGVMYFNYATKEIRIRARAMKAGAAGFLSKPISYVKLGFLRSVKQLSGWD